MNNDDSQKEELYIMSQFALNLHPEFLLTSGDWHGAVWSYSTSYPHKDIETGEINGTINTIDIGKDYGIYDGTNRKISKQYRAGIIPAFSFNNILKERNQTIDF